jgi:hypothetical protein
VKLKAFVCEHCGQTFERRNGKRVYRFCSTSCAQQVIAPISRGYKPLMKKWIAEHGEERAIEMMAVYMQKRSDIVSGKNNPRHGAELTPETRQKIAVSCTGIPNVLKGKTFEEFYGSDRARQLGTNHSHKLKAGYASGKIKPNVRSGSAPIFRGVQLRSLLEQRVIEFLERRNGLIFGQTLLYEDHKTFVQWHCVDGKQHTYVPDLHDTVNDVVYEVKPAWCVRKPTDEMQRKMAALVASGRSCAYLTDEDLR